MKLNINQDRLFEISEIDAPLILRASNGDKFSIRPSGSGFEFYFNGEWYSTDSLVDSGIEKTEPNKVQSYPVHVGAQTASDALARIESELKKIATNKDFVEEAALYIIDKYRNKTDTYDELYLGRCLSIFFDYAHLFGKTYDTALLVLLHHRIDRSYRQTLRCLEGTFNDLEITNEIFKGDVKKMLRSLVDPTAQLDLNSELTKATLLLRDIIRFEYARIDVNYREEFQKWVDSSDLTPKELSDLINGYTRVYKSNRLFTNIYFKPNTSVALTNLGGLISVLKKKKQELESSEENKLNKIKEYLTFACDTEVDRVWDNITSVYSKSNRAYHNIDHVYNMCEIIEKHQLAVNQRDWVKPLYIAAVYHDLIIKPSNTYSAEALSSIATIDDLSELNVGFDTILKAVELIGLTHKHRYDLELSFHGKLFIDADLAILGSDVETYRTYVGNIRKEARAMGIEGDEFNARRKKFLLEMLSDRPKIFMVLTALEEQARKNIGRELESLG
jgi:predicted metal-dependent HD superfamily phosphohydrolase